jgi:hypothetical protein
LNIVVLCLVQGGIHRVFLALVIRTDDYLRNDSKNTILIAVVEEKGIGAKV